MKKILSLISFVSLGLTSIQAQTISEGYYRIRSGNDAYASMVNNNIDKTSYDNLKSGGSGSLYALRLKPRKEVISDPGSIVYISNTNGSYVLSSQGVNTQDITGNLPLEIRNRVGAVTAPSGAYFLYGTYAGATRYLFDSYDVYDTDLDTEGNAAYYTYIYAIGSQNSGNYTVSSKNSNWYFLPIDNNEEYFGITPESDIKVGDKYYTTVYCSFPFQVTGDMKAYYVSGLKASYGAAKLNLIEDGIVPANKAVIIECTSTDPAVNKVKVGVNPSSTIMTSLNGVYFSYIKKSSNGTDENVTENMAKLKNAKTYNPSSMRVLGLSANGELAFVKAADSKLHVTNKGKYLRANKAFVELGNAAETIILNDTGIDTGISSIQNNNVESTDIYNLKGQKVADKGANLDELPRGLYIINGKKVIKD